MWYLSTMIADVKVCLSHVCWVALSNNHSLSTYISLTLSLDPALCATPPSLSHWECFCRCLSTAFDFNRLPFYRHCTTGHCLCVLPLAFVRSLLWRWVSSAHVPTQTSPLLSRHFSPECPASWDILHQCGAATTSHWLSMWEKRVGGLQRLQHLRAWFQTPRLSE